MKRHLPRILITAERSGSGKTTAVCGLLALLKRKGLVPAALKIGPDYIDPMFHRAVLGIPTGNLDTFFTEPEPARSILLADTEGADLAVLEGVMGYFDGLGGISSRGSACEASSVTGTPAVLVVSAKGGSVSCAASVNGFLKFRPDVETPADNGIAGVILNRVSPMYYPKLRRVIEETCGVPVLGYIPERKEFALPSRHLGLVTPEELPAFHTWLETLADTLEETLDLTALLSAAEGAPDLPAPSAKAPEEGAESAARVRIAVSRDEAFCFSYRENEALLARFGAEIVDISPLHDPHLPEDIQGIYLTGGYPELHARTISENKTFLAELRQALEKGMPCIAECGGFLALLQELTDAEGRTYPMAGALPGHGFPAGRLQRFGYFEAETQEDGLFGPAGTVLRGHEFHHWDSDANGEGILLTRPLSGKTGRACVYTENLAAGFPHWYFPSCPQAAEAFVSRCREKGGERC